MKKLLQGLLCLILVQGVSAKESETFVYDGSETVKEIILSKAVYSTHYRTETYETTCSREVEDGTRQSCHNETHQSCSTVPESCSTTYEQVCESLPQTCHSEPQSCQHVCEQVEPACRSVCHSGPNGEICRDVCSAGTQRCHNECSGGGQSCSGGGQNCHSEPRESCTPSHEQCTPYYEQVCETVPNYRTETYACTESREIPYTEFDYNLEAKILMNFAEVPASLGAKESFTLSLTNSDLAIKLLASKKLLVFADKTQIVDSHGDFRALNTKINVSFMNLAEINLAIKNGIDDVELNEQGILKFSVGVFASKIKFKHTLKIMQAKLGKDIEIMNKEIASEHFSLSSLNGKNLHTLDLVKLGVKLTDNTHKITIKSEIVLAKKPMNEDDMPKLEVTKKFRAKL